MFVAREGGEEERHKEKHRKKEKKRKSYASGPEGDVKRDDVREVVEAVRQEGERVVVQGDSQLDKAIQQRQDSDGPDAQFLPKGAVVFVLFCLLSVSFRSFLFCQEQEDEREDKVVLLLLSLLFAPFFSFFLLFFPHFFLAILLAP